MAEENPGLHIDTDWKRQAQEEKRKLAEAEEKRRAEQAAKAPPAGVVGTGVGAAPVPGAAAAGPGASGGAAGAGAARGRRGGREELPPASLATLVQSLLTQTLFYLGEIATRSGGGMVDLDMAKQNVDLLGVLDEKTKGNLTDDERRVLDAALYEGRMRFVSVASQYVNP